MELKDYVNNLLEPVLTVSELWEKKTGLSWEEAKSRGLTDGSYDRNLQLLNNLKNESNPEEIPYIGMEKSLDELTIRAPKDQRVRNQQKLVRDNNYEEDLPYAVIDKGNNQMYLFDEYHGLKSKESIITGRDNTDKDTGISMKTYLNLPENKGKTPQDYFEYLDSTNQQVTPSGVFKIGQHKNVSKDPSLFGRVFNSIFRPERAAQIKESRAHSYGKDGNLLTLIDENGVASSKAIHGTGYEDRIRALATAGGEDNNLSNGCINVGGKTMCFETLEDGSRVFIMPEESDGLIQPAKKDVVRNIFDEEKEVRNSPGITNLVEGKRKLSEIARQNGLDFDQEKLNFIATVAAKETSYGKNRAVGMKDLNPLNLGKLKQKILSNGKYTADNLAYSVGLGDSGGVFQVGHESFKDYLPENYDPHNIVDQMKVVSNFYDANIKQASSYVNKHGERVPSARKLYDLYNAGGYDKTSNNSDKFMELYKVLEDYGVLSNNKK